jgi:hypothetical protein
MLLKKVDSTKSTTSRSTAPSTSTATPWPTIDVQLMASGSWDWLSEPHEEAEDHELALDHFSAAAARLTEFGSAYETLTRVVKAKAEAKSHLLLRDLGSDDTTFLYVGTACPAVRHDLRATGVQAVAWGCYFEPMAFIEPAPPERYPLLRAALAAGRLDGAGLPTVGRRTLRIVDEDDAAPIDEQVRFGTGGSPPADHVRRRRLP